MRVLIFGAGGKTGGLVVERALAEEHDVTVVVRDASRYKREGVRVLVGNATNRDDVRGAMQGQDAVIDTIGGTTPYKSTQLETTAAHNIIEAMQAENARRLIVVSMMGLGDSSSHAPLWYRYLLMKIFLRGSSRDKDNMEREVRASGLEYVIVRPPVLNDGPPLGSVVVLAGNATGHKITRADLANFLVDQLESDEHVRHSVTVVNS